jgi:hypothetical protein
LSDVVKVKQIFISSNSVYLPKNEADFHR